MSDDVFVLAEKLSNCFFLLLFYSFPEYYELCLPNSRANIGLSLVDGVVCLILLILSFLGIAHFYTHGFKLCFDIDPAKQTLELPVVIPKQTSGPGYFKRTLWTVHSLCNEISFRIIIKRLIKFSRKKKQLKFIASNYKRMFSSAIYGLGIIWCTPTWL